MNEEYYMNEAIKEAIKAYDLNEIPVGAVVVKDGKIVGRGHNLKEKNNNAIDHAEIIAIREASKNINNWRLLNTTMYVTMLPCPMCASAINQARISSVVYGTKPDYADSKQIVKILNDKNYGLPVEIIEGPLQNECTELLIKFFQKKRK